MSLESHISAAEAPPEALFTVGPEAISRIAHLLRTEPPGTRLRIGVAGGGCSGFQYQLDFESAPLAADDLVIEEGGAIVALDSVSLEFLAGSRLDYVESLGGSSFEIVNPKAKSSCGCGNSFSVM